MVLRYTTTALSRALSITGNTLFDFPSVRVEHTPFSHFSVTNFCNSTFATRLLKWFESEADWKPRRMENFYVYSDINLRTSELPRALAFLIDEVFLAQLRHEVGKSFSTKLEGFVDVTAHRLGEGDRIRAHSDFVTLRFTHRLLLQVNRGWKPGNGGVLNLLDRDPHTDSRPRIRAIVPQHRSGFAFEVSEKSFHKVTRVREGERYTLLFSFYPPQPAAVRS